MIIAITFSVLFLTLLGIAGYSFWILGFLLVKPALIIWCIATVITFILVPGRKMLNCEEIKNE